MNNIEKQDEGIEVSEKIKNMILNSSGEILNHIDLEGFINQYWEAMEINSIDLKNATNPYYNLMMFPYPSAKGLHVGNFYAFTGADVNGRYKKLQGFDVFEPMGADAFGIHTENFAISINKHPIDVTEENIKNFREQLKKLGALFDWKYEINTTMPEYYKWNQWLFLKLYEHNLIYKKESYVNWCPECNTVISNEQVIDGTCERHLDTLVEKKSLSQRHIKITDFAEDLYDKLNDLDWSKKTTNTQRNWIKKQSVHKVTIPYGSMNIDLYLNKIQDLNNALFVAVPAESDLALQLFSESNNKNIENLIANTHFNRENFIADGINTGEKIINPINQTELPIIIVNYSNVIGNKVSVGYLNNSQYDNSIISKFSLVNNNQIENNNINNEIIDDEELINFLNKQGIYKQDVIFNLKDWCISRQRYRGTPIPIVYCDNCGPVPEKEENLPVTLPYIDNYSSRNNNLSPLSMSQSFINTECPCCKQPAKREVDVIDNFFDSSWYFFRYLSANDETQIFDKGLAKKWTPIDMYTGGNEHAVLHLMYTRFITKFLNKIGMIDFDEPFKKFFAHGTIIKDGKKMSKSKGNVINPDDYIERYGTDCLRLYLMFIGPFDGGGDFTDSGIKGIKKYLNKIQSFFSKVKILDDVKFNKEDLLELINTCETAYETRKYNLIIAKLMGYFNHVLSKRSSINLKEAEAYLKILAPIAPHIAEGLWISLFNKNTSIYQDGWIDTIKQELSIEQPIDRLAIQFNGKFKGFIEVEKNSTEEDILQQVLKNDSLKRFYNIKDIHKKIIYIPGKVFNMLF